MEITTWQLTIMIACAVMVGFTKTGVPTLGIFIAAILAAVFPAKESVGLLTPMLIIGDIIAIVYYRRAVVWKHLLVMLPWVLAGIVVGYLTLDAINNRTLSLMLGTIVLLLVVLQVFKERMERAVNMQFSQSAVFTGTLGLLAGFTTMVGNAAGSIMSIYLLSKGMNKTTFVGTNAFFFFIVNVVKVPFTVHLGLITVDSITMNLWMIPAVAVGAYIGLKVLAKIPQKMFQMLILVLAALGGLNLLLIN